MRAAIAGLFAAVLLSAGAAQAAGDKTVKDWEGVCDNLAACSAFGFSPEGQDIDSYVRITRAGGPDAAPGVLVVFDAPDKVASANWTLTLDGKPIAGVGPLHAVGGEAGARARLTGPAALALIAAMRNGQTLEIRKAGKQLVGVSLAGSAAILLWVDDQQGRVGAVTALARPGGAPASRVPPPAPTIAAAPAADQSHLPPPLPLAAVTAIDDCVASDAAEDSEHLVVRLAPGVILWGPLCSLGAYNELNVFFIGDEHSGALKRVAFPEPPGADPATDDEPMNVSYDPKTRILSSFAKGRGLGDCGSEDAWVWDGHAFQLLKETEISACRGVLEADWPSRYVAALK
jgi:hypothetical protein